MIRQGSANNLSQVEESKLRLWSIISPKRDHYSTFRFNFNDGNNQAKQAN